MCWTSTQRYQPGSKNAERSVWGTQEEADDQLLWWRRGGLQRKNLPDRLIVQKDRLKFKSSHSNINVTLNTFHLSVPDTRTTRVFTSFTPILHPSLCSYLGPMWGLCPSVQLLPSQLPSAGCLCCCSRRWKAVWTVPGSEAAAVPPSSLAQTPPSGTVSCPTVHHSCSGPLWTERSYWPPWKTADWFIGSLAFVFISDCIFSECLAKEELTLIVTVGVSHFFSHFQGCGTCSSH